MWDRRQTRFLRELSARGLVATGHGLVGTFEIVEVNVVSVDLDGTDQICRAFDQLTFVLEAAGVAFDEGILPEGHRDGVIRSLRRTNPRFDPQTLQETQQWRGKILGGPTPDPAGVTIQSDAIRTALLHQSLCHCP